MKFFNFLDSFNNVFSRWWGDELDSRYSPNHRIFRMLSASLNIATFIFFVGFALEFYFVMQGLNSRAFSFLNQFNAPTAIIPGFALSNIFYLRWIKNWKSRVAISIFLDLALFCVSVYLLFFLALDRLLQRSLFLSSPLLP